MLRGFFGGRPPEIDDPQRGEFWALRDVSFDLRRGEALGVIGLNGSGKTTLLRILAGQILPDRGEVRVTGATAAMIDLTAGFQPTASGRRNIFLRAAALGFTRREILALQDEIIAFSELGDAIDAPMKTYSSGMKMRLAFSVMAMLQPDILFIDEVLAVGDFRFRQKCLARIREMRARSAFVFVSHAMGDVSRFCDRVIVLHKGEIAFQGSPDDAIAFYKTLEQNSEPAKPASKPLIPDTVDRPDLVDGLSFAWGDAEGTGKNEIIEGMPVGAKITFNVHYEPRNLIVGVPIYDMEGAVLAGFATDANGVTLRPAAGDRVDLELFVPDSVLNPGRFRVAIGITDGTEFLLMRELPNLIIRPNGRKSWGVASIPHTWRCGIAAAAKTTV
ncbi:MAG: ABC transporter ATP-binding protein [Hyphomonadaceae bacterium]